MKSTILIWSLILTGVACSETDIRTVKPQRTRDVDGIIKLYANQKQGDWMLKGNVVLVNTAIVSDVGKSGKRAIVTGRATANPIPMDLKFHSSEKQGLRLKTGDLLSFKGLCLGMDSAIRFESCVILGISRPTSNP